jgi:hypothetical protein
MIAEPHVDEDDHHLRQQRIGIPVRGDTEQSLENEVQLTEVLVEDAFEDEDRDEGRHRVGQDQQQPVERLEAQVRPLEDGRKGQPDGKAEDDRQHRERHRPNEDREHRRPDALGREDALEILEPDVDPPARRNRLPLLVDVEAARVVRREH